MFAWLLIPLGVVIVVYSNKIVEYIGEIDFAEKIFPGGGTYTFVKLFGLGLTVLSFMWAVGGLQPLLLHLLGPLFGRSG